MVIELFAELHVLLASFILLLQTNVFDVRLEIVQNAQIAANVYLAIPVSFYHLQDNVSQPVAEVFMPQLKRMLAYHVLTVVNLAVLTILVKCA